MTVRAYRRDGTPVSLTDAEAAEAFASGEYEFAADQEVPIRNPEGVLEWWYGRQVPIVLARGGHTLDFVNGNQQRARELQQQQFADSFGVLAGPAAFATGVSDTLTLGIANEYLRTEEDKRLASVPADSGPSPGAIQAYIARGMSYDDALLLADPSYRRSTQSEALDTTNPIATTAGNVTVVLALIAVGIWLVRVMFRRHRASPRNANTGTVPTKGVSMSESGSGKGLIAILIACVTLGFSVCTRVAFRTCLVSSPRADTSSQAPYADTSSQVSYAETSSPRLLPAQRREPPPPPSPLAPFPERVEGLDFGMSRADAARVARGLAGRVGNHSSGAGQLARVTFSPRGDREKVVIAQFCEPDSLCAVGVIRKNARPSIMPSLEVSTAARLTERIAAAYGQPMPTPNRPAELTWTLAGGWVCFLFIDADAHVIYWNEAYSAQIADLPTEGPSM